MAQIPVMLSCPRHGCRLELSFGTLGTFLAWDDDAIGIHDDPAQARPVTAAIAAMDRRTQEALTTGQVTLPRRQVHAGVWFRLLRTLIDELDTPPSLVRSGPRRGLNRVWEQLGHSGRPMKKWELYEHQAWERQQLLLEAASVALQQVDAGLLIAWGTLGGLLTREPFRPVPDGNRPPPPSAWQTFLAELEIAIEQGRSDPDAACRLLLSLTALCYTQKCFDDIRGDLIAAGVQEQFLPIFAEARSGQTLI